MNQIISSVELWFSDLSGFLSKLPYGNLIVSVIMIVLGVICCFLGYRLFSYVISVFGFLAGALFGYYLAGYFTSLLWVCLCCALLFGVLFCFLAHKLYFISCFLAVGIPAAVLSCGLMSTALPALPALVCCVVGLVIGILAGILAIKLQHATIIVASAIYGAYNTIYTIFQLAAISDTRLLLLLTAGLAVAGILFQFSSSGRNRS